MNIESILGIVRHLLTFVGGILVTQGYATDQSAAEGIGALVAAFGFIWSVAVKIKAKSTAVAPIVGVCLASLLLAGCKTTSGGTTWLTAARVQTLSKLVVYTAAAADLSQNPDHREAMKLADQKLRELRAAETWDSLAMLAIIKSLPFDELSSPEATIGFTGTVLLVDLIGIGEFDARRNDHIVAFICGASDGLNLALATEHARGLVSSQLKAEELATRK